MFVDQFLSHQSEWPDILWLFLAGHFSTPLNQCFRISTKPASIITLPTAPQTLIIVCIPSVGKNYWTKLRCGPNIGHNHSMQLLFNSYDCTRLAMWCGQCLCFNYNSFDWAWTRGCEIYHNLYLKLVASFTVWFCSPDTLVMWPLYSSTLSEVTMEFRNSRTNSWALETLTLWRYTRSLNSSSFMIWGSDMPGRLRP